MLPIGMELEQQGAVVTCRFDRRDVDHLDLQEVLDECMQRMRNDNARHFAFDLSPVEFLASACIGSLVGFLQDVEHMRGRIALAGCQDNVKFLFKVTRLDAVFPIFDELTDAVESF